jgi:dihydrofolate reductase
MRKVVAGLFTSLNGVVDGTRNWQLPYFNDEMLQGINAGAADSDAILLGTRTYVESAQLWPTQGSEVPMADFMNNTAKYVVSSTLKTLAWHNSTLLSGNLAQELKKLKQQPGKNILIPGSPRLVRSLLQSGLLDELSLMILPVLVGSGLRLFDEMPEQMGLKLVDSKTYSNGAISVTYQPAKK